MAVSILTGDCRDILKTLPAESVHCVVTSPPYWGLRDYNIEGQMGLEPSLADYVAGMVEVFREVRRVLRRDGTLWLNLGDSYATSVNGRSAADTKADGNDDRTFRDKPFSTISADWKSRVGQSGNKGNPSADHSFRVSDPCLKPKDLCGIPWRVAFALQQDGWYLRSDIIWSKPNPMPESVTDRPTKAHEYLFLLSKSERYFYDAEAIREPLQDSTIERGYTAAHLENGGGPKEKSNTDKRVRQGKGWWDNAYVPTGRNRRTVWEIATQPFPDAHFATFPPALIEPCILAGCPKECCAKCGAPWVRVIEQIDRGGDRIHHNMKSGRRINQLGGQKKWDSYIPAQTLGWSPSCSCNEIACQSGTVLDCFGGAGTTGLVADRVGCNAILIELNPTYAEMAQRRLRNDAGMFAEINQRAPQGEYDPIQDVEGSFSEAYRAIRERVAAGGPGWTPRCDKTDDLFKDKGGG